MVLYFHFAESMKKHNIDMFSLQDVRWKGKDAIIIWGGHKVLWSVGREAGNGVYEIVAGWLVEQVVVIKWVDKRLLKLKVVIIEYFWKVASCYSTKSDRPAVEHDKFCYKGLRPLKNSLLVVTFIEWSLEVP